MACGAAAGTEVVESRGWRVPIYLGGGLVALAILGVILAIAAMSDREETAQNPTPTPSASAAPPATTTPSPLPTTDPVPTATVDPLNPEATPTVDPLNPEATVAPEDTPSPEPTTEPTPAPTDDPGLGTTGSFSGNNGDWTIIIASETSESKANKVADQAADKNITAEVLNSDDYSSLNGGYWVVYSGAYAKKSEAEDALGPIRADYSDAYVKKIEE
ncbi:SPOR domain-containing protein [Solirubrobacter pauli]|uniref:SPOR domain-containing protein n=1 Tax=Solirubrobacter pauli TaxID=166793 RepID=UPI0011C42D57|nr:SPOR domain-containing protein [Solirubrobacter pauli]